MSAEIAAILKDGCVDELKWHKIKGAKARICANAVLDWVIRKAIPRDARVDVLVWDITDSRHRIARRDDRKNFERMFFHLHKASMSKRPAGEDWHLRPDERQDIDWETIRSCLESVGGWRQYFDNPLLGENLSIANFNIASFKEVSSKATPLCQVADLFAGMGSYSRLKSFEMTTWLQQQTGQGNLFGDTVPIELSGRDKERFPLIRGFYQTCRSCTLGVSLESTGYLRTPDPSRPINFWHYVPQHGADVAPTADV